MKKSILIIGANGFIGSYLIKYFFNHGFDLTATYNVKKKNLLKTKGIRYLRCDISNYKDVKKLFSKRKYCIVINAATKFDNKNQSLKNINEVFNSNVIGQHYVVSEALKNMTKIYIYFSSISVYEGLKSSRKGFLEEMNCSPSTLYASCKILSENILKKICTVGKMKGIVLRLPGVHGGERKNGVIYNFITKSLKNQELQVKEPKSIYKVLFINDLASALMKVINHKENKNFALYNLASDESFSLSLLAKNITKITKSGKIKEENNNLKKYQLMNNDKFKKKFQFKGTSLNQFLQSTFKSIKKL